MNLLAVVIYFLIVVALIGGGIALLFKFRYSVADFESRITGIWTNEANTLRILIYSLESQFWAKVVWTKNDNDPILGALVIHSMYLNRSSTGLGIYVDPLTKEQFNVKVKLKHKGQLQFHLYEGVSLRRKKVEGWRLVQ